MLVFVFGLGEGAAEEGRDLERGKELTAHANGMDRFGDACGGQVIACSLIAAEVGKAVGVAHVVDDVRSGGSRPGAHIAIGTIEGVSQDDQTVWRGEGQRAEKNTGDDGEDGSGGSDAQGQHQDGGDGEPGRVTQLAEGVTRVLQGLRQPLIGSLVAMHLLGLLDAPVGAPGGLSRFLWSHAVAEIVIL